MTITVDLAKCREWNSKTYPPYSGLPSPRGRRVLKVIRVVDPATRKVCGYIYERKGRCLL